MSHGAPRRGITHDRALAEAARPGALDYERLLLAATELCRSAPPELAARFDVLMVDELQDTNAAQLAFYDALVRVRPARPLVSFFVGDARQSIYRFRDADPYGWLRLVDAAKAEGTCANIRENWRSTPALVGLHRSVVGGLIARGEAGVDPLDDLAPGEPNSDSSMSDPWPEPVVVVDAPEASDADPLGLAAFARRLLERWETHADESAAVLVRSWAAGERAVRALRTHGVDAQLTGDRGLLTSRVAIDVRLFLRALYLDVIRELKVKRVDPRRVITTLEPGHERGASGRPAPSRRPRGQRGDLLRSQRASVGPRRACRSAKATTTACGPERVGSSSFPRDESIDEELARWFGGTSTATASPTPFLKPWPPATASTRSTSTTI